MFDAYMIPNVPEGSILEQEIQQRESEHLPLTYTQVYLFVAQVCRAWNISINILRLRHDNDEARLLKKYQGVDLSIIRAIVSKILLDTGRLHGPDLARVLDVDLCNIYRLRQAANRYYEVEDMYYLRYLEQIKAQNDIPPRPYNAFECVSST